MPPMRAFLFALLLVSCGAPADPTDAGIDEDAGLDDAGAPTADASPGDDAGSGADAGVDAGGAPLPAQRAFFVGNSYTIRNDLPELYAAAVRSLARVPDPLVTDRSTAGGKRLVEHVTDARVAGHPLHTALNTDEGEWTHFVLQEQSQIPGFPEGQPDFEVSRTAAGELADLAQMRGATVVLFVTWGRREGDAMNPGLYPDYSTMQDRLDDGYDALAEAARDAGADVRLAPVGTAFRVIHDAEVDPLAPDSRFGSLYDTDGSHPSLAGSYLAACVFVATLLDVDPRTVTHVPDGLDPDEAIALREAAAMAVMP